MSQKLNETTERESWDVLREAARKLERVNPVLSGKLVTLADSIQEIACPFVWAMTKPESRPGRITDRGLHGILTAVKPLKGSAVESAAEELEILATTVEEPLASPYIFGLQGTLPATSEDGGTLVLLGDPNDDAIYSVNEHDDDQSAFDEAERLGERGIRAFVVSVLAVFGPDSVAENDDDDDDDGENDDDENGED